MKLDYKDQIGNTILIDALNAKCTNYDSKLRERWNGRFQGLKEYNRQDRDDNYVVVNIGSWLSHRDGCYMSDRYIVVNGNRYYLNYQNSITGRDDACTLYLVDIDALQKSKPYKFDPKFDENRDEEHKVVKFDSFDQLRQLAKEQYKRCDNQIPTIHVRVVGGTNNGATMTYSWDYEITSNATDEVSKYTYVKQYI